MTPIAVRIGGIGVDAPVVPVGLEPNGEMEIPDSVAQVGWYRLGAVPGRPGSAVLAGHVDSRAQGRGAFFALSAVEPGATVTVVDARGAEHRFEVVARRQFPKDGLPSDLFSNTGDARLALITCGGDFNRATRSYRDNVVVYAVAV
jgi:sortase (surface protein transpeptidase)